MFKINALGETHSLNSAYTVDTQFSHKIEQNQGVEHGNYAPGKVDPQTANANTMCRINSAFLTALVPRFEQPHLSGPY